MSKNQLDLKPNSEDESRAIEAINYGLEHARENGQSTAAIAVTEKVTEKALSSFISHLGKLTPPVKAVMDGKPKSDPPRRFLVLSW